nr:MAG TPA: hypothetical protein [Caudoviricetes sp.]
MKFIELYDENGVIEHLKAMNDELLNEIQQLTDAQRLKFFDCYLVMISETEGNFRSNSKTVNPLLEKAEKQWLELSNQILELQKENKILKNKLLEIRRLTNDGKNLCE